MCELRLDHVGAVTGGQNARTNQGDQQLAKRGSNLMPAALHWRRTGAARQVFVDETLDYFIGKVTDVNAATASPSFTSML